MTRETKRREHSPQCTARAFAKRLDDLIGLFPHLICELDEALTRCGGSVYRDAFGVLGQAGIVEQVFQNIDAMLNGTCKDALPKFETDVERALVRSKHT